VAIAFFAVPFAGQYLRGAVALTPNSAAALTFFAAIGFGFMFFESAQMQRFTIFLGYPVYALTVTLFSLLLASAAGAWMGQLLWTRFGRRGVLIVFPTLLAALIAAGIATPAIIEEWAGADTPVRILMTALVITPPGLLMGTCLPFGMRLTESRRDVSLAWCWAINGITSTCAAVYSIAMSISFGITFTYAIAVGCYGVAAVAALSMVRGRWAVPDRVSDDSRIASPATTS
jgi:hypothetical protein